MGTTRRKGLMIGFFGALVLFLIVAGLLYFSVRGAGPAADRFLSLVQSNQLGEAYRLTSERFQNQVTESAFRDQVETLGLVGYTDPAWKSSITAPVGDVPITQYAGAVKSPSGETVRLLVQMEKRDGVWQVGSIEKMKEE